MPLSLTYVTDEAGQRQAVQIPYDQWLVLQKELQGYLQEETLRQSLNESFRDIAAMEAGRKPKVTLDEFLAEVETELEAENQTEEVSSFERER
ncbi:hypothetical protein [Hymenobacter lapidiphilus]|uniref:Uncharacterized protein n=1 Tax=Hymenobacter lapidiphilus TaxID=2608003 RepID=A0A7Y7PNS5_9BACT|nr:hypothetical protein [Hymenobacter lapidiphilus]NVO31112.1 hypothetical protein [Hymenobacter lapidiphilus]